MAQPETTVQKCSLLKIGDCFDCICDIGQWVLVVGDGDLSYSLALATRVRDLEGSPSHLICTCYLAENEFLALYGDQGQQSLVLLKDLGCIVLLGFDATDMASGLSRLDGGPPVVDRVIWNFPQHPDHRFIQKHRDLLRQFFASAAGVLAEDGRVLVTLRGGQGGSAYEMVHRKYSNTWKIQEQASYSGFILVTIGEADVEELIHHGYRSSGNRNGTKGFRTDHSLCHGFQRAASAPRALLPIRYTHDLCFWVHSDFSEETFDAFLVVLFPSYISYHFELFDEYDCKKTGKSSKGFHVTFFSNSEGQCLDPDQAKEYMRLATLAFGDVGIQDAAERLIENRNRQEEWSCSREANKSFF